jgi:hypothetical protein
VTVLNRRQFLAAVALGSLSACSAGKPGPPTTIPGSTTTTVLVPSPDIAALRLGSSIEHYLVSLYGLAAGSGLLRTQDIIDAAKYFSDQHADHAGAFEQATRDHGGEPFTSANPVIAEMFKPRLDALTNEADVVKLAYDVEVMTAATYDAAVGHFEDLHLNAAMTRICGIEARHIAVFGMMLSGLPAPLPGVAVRDDSPAFPLSGLQSASGAVAPGTGV